MTAKKKSEPPFLNLGKDQPNEFILVGHADKMPIQMRGQLHRHTHYELMWLSGSEAVFFSDFEEYLVPINSVVFVRPGQLHAWKSNWEQLNLIFISFRPELLTQQSAPAWLVRELPFYDMVAQPFMQIDALNLPLFMTLFQTVQRHFAAFGESQLDLLAAHVRLLLAECKRLYEPLAQERQNGATTAVLANSFQQAVELHFLDKRSTQPYADLLGVTANHLARIIRQATGMTPGQIIRNRLTLEAKRLLAHTDLTVSETAYRLGFPSTAQFSNWFKRQTAVSPDKFRRAFHQA